MRDLRLRFPGARAGTGLRLFFRAGAVEEPVPLELYHGAKVYLGCAAHLEFVRAVSCIGLLGRGYDSYMEKTIFRMKTQGHGYTPAFSSLMNPVLN